MTSKDQDGLARASVTGSRGSEALQKLKRGEVTIDEYIDSRVDRALASLHGRVSDEQREFLRGMLRDQIAAEPLLQEYVRRIAGRAPSSWPR
jgi:hypothetical protein